MSCYGLKGAYQHKDVQIGWFAYRTTAPAAVTTKPGGGRVKSIDADGHAAALKKGEGFCVQSERNPDGKLNPGHRPAVKGPDGRWYVWGYQRRGARTGWIALDVLTGDPNKASKNEAKGPAGEDFEVGRGAPSPGRGPGCGKLSLSRPKMRVTAGDMHLRYSPHGTGYHYLHAGDTVKVLIKDAPQGQSFVEVLTASPDGSVRAGARGWVSTGYLERA